jgi:hypothetical protein
MSAKTPNEQVGALQKAAADGLTFAKLFIFAMEFTLSRGRNRTGAP